MSDFTDRTAKAFGPKVMKQLRDLRFCIVGCGGTGANFAEMLVRSGAIELTLIDGDQVHESNLNRVFPFDVGSIGARKVDALKARLEAISPGSVLNIQVFPTTFKEREYIVDDELGQPDRNAVHDSDVVFVGTDTNLSRLGIEKLNKLRHPPMLLSCGILVDRENGVYELECSWSPHTPPERAEDEGYGPENASFPSIVLEATSIAFTMLISHLAYPDSRFTHYVRRYDANFQPIKTIIDGRSSCNTQSWWGSTIWRNLLRLFVHR